MAEEKKKTDDANDKGGDDKSNNIVDNSHMVPKSRLDAEIDKKKVAETALDEVANALIEEIPEDMRDVVPDLPPAEKIKWLQAAKKKDLFKLGHVESPDSKRPGGKPSTDFENMNPHTMRESGYKT
jgi:hypothetical protein